jgi:hypothetical protein
MTAWLQEPTKSEVEEKSNNHFKISELNYKFEK